MTNVEESLRTIMKNKFSTDLRSMKTSNKKQQVERKRRSYIDVATFEISFLINIEFLSYDIARIFFYTFVY